MGKRQRKPTVTQAIMLQVKDNFSNSDLKYTQTKQQYIKHCKFFVDFCRKNYDCRTLEECSQFVQSYSDYLVTKDYSASTIHTYLAPICKALRINMADIKKPKRHTSQYTKGRDNSINITMTRHLYDEEYQRMLEFQYRVGCRKSELLQIKGSSLMYDESGVLAVEIPNGKGNKYQLQRLNSPEDEEYIRKIFEGKEDDEYVFSRQMIKNCKEDLHNLRARSAREYYFSQLRLMRKNPEYSKTLEEQIRKRWEKYNIDKRTGKPKKFMPEKYYGNYTLRGDNRKLGKALGIGISFNKLALLATSVFKLSHWRLDVTCQSYIVRAGGN